MRGGLTTGSPALGAALGALEGLFDPAAGRAQEARDAEHQHVIPAPTPGDDLLKSGVLRIRRPAPPAPAPNQPTR
jgi:hypothetical protein